MVHVLFSIHNCFEQQQQSLQIFVADNEDLNDEHFMDKKNSIEYAVCIYIELHSIL